MFSPVKSLGQLHVWDLGWRPMDLWWIVPSGPGFELFSPMVTFNLRPFEAEVILFEFFFSEIGKMGCSVNSCALTTHGKKSCVEEWLMISKVNLIVLEAKVKILLERV